MNKKLIAFAALVFAVVLTSFSVSGTYAKYTTTIPSKSDSARIAIWNVYADETTKETVDLFGRYYDATGKVIEGDTGVVSGANKVVAPGTKGEFTFGIKGNVETNYTLEANVSTNGKEFFKEEIKDGGATYKPVKFTLKDNKESKSQQYDSLAALIAGLETDINDSTKVYKAGEIAKTYTISWEWTFDNGHDDLDTQLAQTIAQDAEAVTITFSITANQSNLAAN